MAYRIYLSPPSMCGKELEFVKDAFASNWIAPVGPFVAEFEHMMAEYIGVSHSLAVSSGTAAIHLILRWLGVGEGDLIFCSDFTFIGSCAPVLYERATPVFIDSEPETWNMSPVALEKAFEWAKGIGKMPKAVIIVDLYGESADWDSLLPVCRRYGVTVIEDAAEAAGSTYNGKRCGGFGDYSVLSFNGNKIITTSGGGMVLSENKEAIDKMHFWTTQAREPFPWYEHNEYGYNYRLSNISAAVGCGQLAFLGEKLKRRKEIYEVYKCELPGVKCWTDGANNWLTLAGVNNPMVMVSKLAEAGIESRPAWKPMHMQPVFSSAGFISHYDNEAVDESIFAKMICLPSGDGLTNDELAEIIGLLKS